MITDMAMINEVEGTVTKIRRVDERNKTSLVKQRIAVTSEEDGDKTRFIKPIAQLMMDCKVGYRDNSSATDDEIRDSLWRRARRVVRATDIPTLHRAVTTSNELREHLEERDMHMGMDNIEPIALEAFLWQSHAQVRAVNAVIWMCDTLQLGWPVKKAEMPDAKGTVECKKRSKSPSAQPGMLKVLEEAMEAGAETRDPTWLAYMASWIQAMTNLRLGHVLRRSVPVERFEDWMVFFCKRSDHKHNRAGFYWGVPSETSTGYDWTKAFLMEYDTRRKGE